MTYLFSLFLLTVATTVGTVVAYLIVPMRSLGQDSWKIAAALMGRHIGGGNLCYYLCLQIHARWPVRFLSIFLLRITLSSSIVVDLVVYFHYIFSNVS